MCGVYEINTLDENFSGLHRVASTISKLNWNLGLLVFVERGKREYLEKKPSEQG